MIKTATPNKQLSPAAANGLTLAGLVAGIIAIVIHCRMTDFPVDMIIYRGGVRAFITGEEMYSVPMYAGDLALPFIYPPFGALVMVPLAAPSWMGDDLAGDLMIVLSDLLVLACLYLVLRAVWKRATPEQLRMVTALTWAITMAIEPVRLNNGFAQLNIVLMALVVFDLVPRKRWLPQGWLIGVAAAIKLTPLAMLLYFLLRKDFKAIITAGISALACTALAAIWRLDATVEFFFGTLLGMGSSSNFGVNTAYQSNSSIKGVLLRVFSSQEALDNNGTVVNIAWLALSLAVIGVGSLLMLQLMRRRMDVDAWLVGSMIMLFISPVSWSHHWIWLTLILPVLTYRAWTWRNDLWQAGALLAILGGWWAMVITVPPKWWFGDSIDVFGQTFYQKFLVNDFIWLSLIAIGFYWYCLRRVVPPASIDTGVDDAASRKTASY